jgi:hypothetical protein
MEGVSGVRTPESQYAGGCLRNATVLLRSHLQREAVVDESATIFDSIAVFFNDAPAVLQELFRSNCRFHEIGFHAHDLLSV